MTSDAELLRRAIAISVSAVEHGNHPFGSLLTNADGEVVLEAENTVVTGRDVTGHAETNLVRLATGMFAAEELRSFTLYTSCEPCAMCSGAIYWAGIGRVVYALSEEGLLGLTGSHPENPTLNLPCRVVFAAGQGTVEVSGPQLEDEAAVPHRTFWA
ncbi:nucleoside deaminase [Microbacteriaceae bacterium VKM Ac-2855]|nr:nucleoside deaminase [Microbacteriaceae bacterium VKM Ac-2855]